MDTRSTWSLVAISLGLVVAGTGTYAFFTDTGFSQGNVFTHSTLDMHLANDGGPFEEGVNATLGNANFSPGDVVEGTLHVRNDGTIEAHKVDLDVAFAVSVTDNRTNGARMDRNLTLLNLSYNDEDLRGKACWRTQGGATFSVLQDANGNGRLDVHDLRTQACADLAVANLAQAPGGFPFRLQVEFWTGAGNHDQGDTVRLNVTFRMAQLGAADLDPSESGTLFSEDFEAFTGAGWLKSPSNANVTWGSGKTVVSGFNPNTGVTFWAPATLPAGRSYVVEFDAAAFGEGWGDMGFYLMQAKTTTGPTADGYWLNSAALFSGGTSGIARVTDGGTSNLLWANTPGYGPAGQHLWHHWKVTFTPTTITLQIDGGTTGTVSDATWTGPMHLGLWVGGQRGSAFDNVVVKAI